ncbi:hypothetical protein CYMTET_8932 [Cymbomonas tetramitiformis]|uniref:START domain-containing protein n=1 Tax=Cymbomonas tetramitiformis TaxID=36881 RepID=A0AAE0LFI8_9CHLO|nr:hypothetical protein CYMTET_8932 [Cymbomonas tetramitiformis]
MVVGFCCFAFQLSLWYQGSARKAARAARREVRALHLQVPKQDSAQLVENSRTDSQTEKTSETAPPEQPRQSTGSAPHLEPTPTETPKPIDPAPVDPTPIENHPYATKIEPLREKFLHMATLGTAWDKVESAKYPEVTISLQTHPKGFTSVKTEIEVEASPADVLRVLEDLEQQLEWDRLVAEVRHVERLSETTNLVYAKTKREWPTSARDMILLTTRGAVSDGSGSMYLANESIQHPAWPEQRGCVRATCYPQGYLIAPLLNRSSKAGGQRCKVTAINQTDPGGNLPSSLVKMVSLLQIPKSLCKLKKKVEDDRASHARETLNATPEVAPAITNGTGSAASAPESGDARGFVTRAELQKELARVTARLDMLDSLMRKELPAHRQREEQEDGYFVAAQKVAPMVVSAAGLGAVIYGTYQMVQKRRLRVR